jgi:hypothetical protein
LSTGSEPSYAICMRRASEAIVELSRVAQDGRERLSGIDGFLTTFWYSEERPKLRIKHVAVSRWADEQMLFPKVR